MKNIQFTASLILNVVLFCLSLVLFLRLNTIQTTNTPLSSGKFSFPDVPATKGSPQFSNGSISPFDAQKGEVESVSIQIKHNKPITQVYVSVKGDSTTVQHQLQLSSGTKINGVWNGSWKTDDTYKNTYTLLFQAYMEDGTYNQLDMRFRSPSFLKLSK